MHPYIRNAVAASVILAIFASPPVGAEDGATIDIGDIIDVHAAQENVGLAIVAMDSGKFINETYLGDAAIEHGIRVTEDTRFQVMSITKAFVGAALIKTLSQGLVDLDMPIQTYLPDYPVPKAGTITLRNLSSHTAGIPHLGHPDRKALYVEHYKTAVEALAVFEDLPLIHEPGAAYGYSSSHYTLIAAALEAVHEKPFAVILRELVLDPLGLTSTAPGNVLAPTPNLARNYSYVDIWTYELSNYLQQVPTWDFSYNVGGGNLVTTARDLAVFANAFVAPGFFTEQELGILYRKIDPEKSQWTFGWFVGEGDDGEPFLSISGATPGVQAGLSAYPSSQVVLAVISNSWGKNSAGGALVIDVPREAAKNYIDMKKSADD